MTNNSFVLQAYPQDQWMTKQLSLSPLPLVCNVWSQDELCVVLGKGSHLDKDVKIEAVLRDNIPVYRREGGGGTVVLSSGMWIIAVAAHMKDPFGSKRYFRMIQEPIQHFLENNGLQNVKQMGLSDLAINRRKILGSSMRRKKTLLLYQAVLLVSGQRSLFPKYLKHPPHEPDYREGRQHEEFTVTLEEMGVHLLDNQTTELQRDMQVHLEERLSNELLSFA